MPGLIPPPWWGVDAGVVQAGGTIGDAVGIEVTGRVLATVGLAHPVLNPEQVVLYWVEESV